MVRIHIIPCPFILSVSVVHGRAIQAQYSLHSRVRVYRKIGWCTCIDLPHFFGPGLMRVFPHDSPFLPLVWPDGSVPYPGIAGHRLLGFDSPDYYAVGSDYNPFANARQHILIPSDSKTIHHQVAHLASVHWTIRCIRFPRDCPAQCTRSLRRCYPKTFLPNQSTETTTRSIYL